MLAALGARWSDLTAQVHYIVAELRSMGLFDAVCGQGVEAGAAARIAMFEFETPAPVVAYRRGRGPDPSGYRVRLARSIYAQALGGR
jgi:hypothetical protein